MTNGETSQRDILGVRVRALGWVEALAWLEHALGEGEPQRVVNFLNAHNANLACANPAYRRALARSEVLADGIGLDIASRVLHGTPFPSNLNGTDLVPALLVHLRRPLRIALIGACDEVLKKAAANFRGQAPWHDIRGISHGYFDRSKAQEVLHDLAAFAPDVTLVAFGSPAQELWIGEHLGAGHGRLIFGVGALFDFISGTVPRASGPVRDLRLEWVYRLLMEPGRLWRRYILGNPLFLYRVLRYRLSGPQLSTGTAR